MGDMTELIGKDAFEYLTGRNSLLDSTLTSLYLSDVNGRLTLELNFKGHQGAEYNWATIKFISIIEFGFYYSNRYVFYNVESIKFLMINDDMFYLSLDPDECSRDISGDDQDFVTSKAIELIVS